MDSGTLLSKRIKKAMYKDAKVRAMSMKSRRALVLLRGNSRINFF